MGKTKSPLWWTLSKVAILLGLVIGVPILLSTDRFLRWLTEKAYADKWTRASALTYHCAGYYRWTNRLERASETYELFLKRWPEDELLPDAVYACALSWRDLGDELEYTAHGNAELRQKREELREKAEGWLTWLMVAYPGHPLAFKAERAACNIRNGY